MEMDEDQKKKLLELSTELSEQLRADQPDKVNQLLIELTGVRDNSLFYEVGKLTRELHEALSDLLLNDHVLNLAEHDIPNATQKLNYVIAMTEQSAHRTLDAVEQNMQLSQGMHEQIMRFRQAWEKFEKGGSASDALPDSAQDMNNSLEQLDSDLSVTQRNLTEIMLAQESQDLSGQIIRKVIQLVHDVENSLVNIVRLRGHAQNSKTESSQEIDNSHGFGPSVPGTDTNEHVQNQDDVDELLTSLGF